MQAKLLFGVLAALVAVSVVSAQPVWYSITGSQSNYRVQAGQVTGSLAEAYLDSNAVHTTGWGTLGLYTDESSPATPSAKAHAAGYLEGTLSLFELRRFCILLAISMRAEV